MNYRKNTSLEQRIKDSNKQLDKNPDHIPVILECDKSLQLEKYKLMVPQDLSVSHLLLAVRKQVKNIKPDEALFLLCENVALVGSAYMSEIYNDALEKRRVVRRLRRQYDMFLYVYVSRESTFGTFEIPMLVDRYKIALQTVQKFKDEKIHVSKDDMLSLYGLYKRVTVGINFNDEPPFYRPREKAKWKAWKDVSMISRAKAMEKYVNLVDVITVLSKSVKGGVV